MNKFTFELEWFFKTFLRLFFAFLNSGNECAVCGKRTGLYPLCRSCQNNYFSVEKAFSLKRCKVCGKTLISTEEICLQCRENPVLKSIDYVMPLFSYRLWNKELMFMWKNREVRSVSDLFALYVRDALWKLGIKVVVPVPPRPGKIRKKGWDQIDELCRFLKYRWGFVVWDVLERSSECQQKKLDRNGRLETIGHSYSLKSGRSLQKALRKSAGRVPEKVCIVDDVCTTGATLESCASVLKSFGVKTVNAVTLFIVG